MNAPLTINNQVSWVDLSDPKMRACIDAFVKETRGSLFHTPNWLEGVERATGHKAAGLVSERLGAINGWLPVTQLRSPLCGKALLSSGFAVGGGVLAPDQALAVHLEHGPKVPALESGPFFFPIDGACHRIGIEETAFAHRDAKISLVIAGSWQNAADNEKNIRWVRDYFRIAKQTLPTRR